MKKVMSFLGVVLFLFSSCQNDLSENDKKEYIAKGKEIAKETGSHLSGQLTKQMKEGGVIIAVPFCNTMAMPLTDEISEKYSASIKRTSLKVRNEKNSPSVEETRILKQYKNLLNTNEKLTPIVELDLSGNPHFYAPILLQQKCLTCHGEIGINVTSKTDSIIESYYPNDIATGFKEGDLRGIWSIAFKSD